MQGKDERREAPLRVFLLASTSHHPRSRFRIDRAHVQSTWRSTTSGSKHLTHQLFSGSVVRNRGR